MRNCTGRGDDPRLLGLTSCGLSGDDAPRSRRQEVRRDGFSKDEIPLGEHTKQLLERIAEDTERDYIERQSRTSRHETLSLACLERRVGKAGVQPASPFLQALLWLEPASTQRSVSSARTQVY